MAAFQLGPHTLAVPMSLHAENRRRVVAALRTDPTLPDNAVIAMQGGKEESRHDTDHEHVFRQVCVYVCMCVCVCVCVCVYSLVLQESFFHWAFGVRESDCFGAIDVSSGQSHLFVPRLGIEYAVWMGRYV